MVAVQPTDLPNAWTELKYHPVQDALWRSESRFAAVVAGRGSGKTELAKRRLIRFLPVQKPWVDPRYFYAGPTYTQAKRTAWNHFLRLIPSEWIDNVNLSDLMIRTIFGSELWVVGMDAPQRVEGVQWDGCVIDESSDIKPKTFDLSVTPALTWRHGWCWRIGVPKRFGVGAAEFREFYDAAASGELEDAQAFNWPSADIIPLEEVESARRRLDPVDFREQFEAHFETAGGGIFHAFDEEWNVRPCSYHNDKPLLIGMDFNVDPMCWVICHAYKKGLEVVDEIFRRNTTTAQTLEYLIGKYRNHTGGFAFFGDASSKSRNTSADATDYLQILNHEGFKKLGRTVHFPEKNPSHVNGFASVNGLLCNAAGDRNLFIAPNCKNLIRDMKLRSYKPGTREPSDKGQVTDVGHTSDGLVYIVWRVFPIKLDTFGTEQIGIRR